MFKNSNSGSSSSFSVAPVVLLVIKDHIMVIIPGQILDFARSCNFNSSTQSTWSILFEFSNAVKYKSLCSGLTNYKHNLISLKD